MKSTGCLMFEAQKQISSAVALIKFKHLTVSAACGQSSLKPVYRR